MDVIEHKERHKILHKYLDELVADFISNTKTSLLSETSLMTLMKWSSRQIKNPDEYDLEG